MRASLSAAFVIGVAAASLPTEVDACGGTFCGAPPPPTPDVPDPPTPMPIPQTGENVLFLVDDTHVEAHIQIQYSGDPEEFAWIVPVVAVPEVGAGSQALFENLLEATVPTFAIEEIPINCNFGDAGAGDAQASGGLGGGCGPESDESDAASPSAGPGGSHGNPDVIGRGVAGAFEYAVLEGGTVEGVVTWLDENGYAQDDEAPDILAEYLEAGFLFVAFRLRPGAGLDALHPVVIRYAGDEPCVPIRLTRIAATDDMGIRLFFLGQARAVPTNYRHVRLNPVHFDWDRPGENYLEVVTLAVDEEGADGHGFVTEYAGTASVVDNAGIHDERWDPSAFVELTREQVVPELVAQGLLSCDQNGWCDPLHPLIGGLIEQYLPADDPTAWSGAEFADELDRRIVQPALHALELLEQPYLTRLFTTISPHEMTEDPIFHVNADLGDVSNAWTAKLSTPCSGRSALTMGDDRYAMSYDNDAELPDLSQTPAAELIEEMPAQGAPITVTDFREAIQHELAEWNRDPGGSGGCGCRVVRLRLEGVLAIALLVAGLPLRRRRSRH